MLNYYTATVFISVIFSIIMLSIISYDEVLEKINKKMFFTSFILLIIASTSEWLAVILEDSNKSVAFLNTFLMSTCFLISITLPIFLALSIIDNDSKRLKNISLFTILLCFLVSYFSLFTNIFFYYDENAVYHRGVYFNIYFLLILTSFIVFFISIYNISKKYAYRNNIALFANLIFFLFSIYAHFLIDDVDIIWISYTFTLSLVYIHYTTLINQIDALTHLLNRRCYENKLYDIKQNAIILNIDVNKFKQFNDTYGHSMGDTCLFEIGKTLKHIYGNKGLCYRVGGDEFSVIVLKDLENIDKLNEEFIASLNKIKINAKMPTVSIGYSNYYVDISNIQKVLEDADKMMYLIKSNYNKTTI